MTNQNVNAIELIENDLAAVNDELDDTIDTITAAEILLGIDREDIKQNTMSIQDAARIVADADLSPLTGDNIKTLTLSQIVDGLKGYKESLDREWYDLDYEMLQLIAVNHDQTIKWARQEFHKARSSLMEEKEDQEIDQVAAIKSRFETLKDCLRQLKNIKTIHEGQRKPRRRKRPTGDKN